ncbi:chemotaxis protein CheW [Cereibacter sphaeroides]|uniref:chemotaxis protein CheA n=1 Tax=Rhodobacterales TaxID=204455 RepID=UPI000BBF2C5F|nr:MULTISPECIES: chemotaxis protein CheW [Paracoccaceae]MCE6961924.1 chemotaxis protein CheW [Cereibacter sphaeroides]MCE6970699.1 chemotaxis protein CheW [Cereibacter sphaeroides]MCE6975705.1 chemotaxis protein CheW [Cereibacter sphaeroides]
MSAATDTGPDGGLMRVSSQKISRLMDLVGELSLSVSETVHSPDLEGLELAAFDAAVHRLTMIVREVQDAATELRLVPVDEVFKRLRRMVRELERQTGKSIEMVLEGEDTAIDKLVADQLYDPLLHVVRNSADHGLETPDERRAAGKPETGRITLSAAQIGSEVRITVADDGRGLSRDKILKRARERGLFGPDEEPDPATLWKVIFQPGFSTAETVTNLSGRGVGMDVLNATMTALRGRIGVDSRAGQGSEVSLHIPVSLAFLDCIILRLGARLYALPIDVVSEIVQPSAPDIMGIGAAGGTEMLRLRGRWIPVCRLERFYDEAGADLRPLPAMVLAVVATADGPIALPVDEVIDRQQVVMKPLAGRLARVRASWGCALLGTGEVALVLDCNRLHGGAAA